MFSFLFCLSLLFLLSSGCAYTSISTRQHQVVFRYLEDTKSEKDLQICEANSVCSVLHKRFWLPPIAERICRCPSAEECPWKWQNKPDNQTMSLNNRAQLKFCSPITQLPTCTQKLEALTTVKTISASFPPFFAITVTCFCPFDHHWRHTKTSNTISHQNATETIREIYKCASLKKCKSSEFCGNVRNDFNAIYYQCSCPQGHYCMFNDTTPKIIDELMYKGLGNKAYCELINDFDY